MLRNLSANLLKTIYKTNKNRKKITILMKNNQL